MPMSVVLFGSLGLIVLLAVFLAAEIGIVAAVAGALLVVLFGFLFVTVSARLTGEIGSSSNPISGMTTATLMLTCLIFLALGWQSSAYRLVALSVAAVVCIASSNGGTTAQSLKTGFLVGGTPKFMQYAILIGALVSALVIGGTLLVFNESRAVVSTKLENVPDFTLNKTELGRLKETVTYESKIYDVWHTKNDALTAPDEKAGYKPRPELLKLSERRAIYYVDPDTGKLAALKDNTIMGELEERDDGSYVKREFDAPKTQVMGIVINGVLKGDLNWSMIGIGAMIALMLELCGVSALAFAVGVYVPIQYSAPIFMGGIVRWCVDRYLARQAEAEARANLEAAIAAAGDDPVARMEAEAEAKAQAEIEAIRKSETSGGVLMASGFIAGGSLAGVLLGFLAFSDDLPDDLQQWKYTKVAITASQPFDQAAEDLARKQLGLTGSDISEKQQAKMKELTEEIKSLSKNQLYEWVRVPKGTTLKLPEGKGDFSAPSDMVLKDVAREQLGRERKAAKIFDKNKDVLKLPADLPPGAELSLPQQSWPAWIAFLGLAGFILAVGVGYLLRPPPQGDTATDNGVPAPAI
jgi:hypothetical protein